MLLPPAESLRSGEGETSSWGSLSTVLVDKGTGLVVRNMAQCQAAPSLPLPGRTLGR